MTDSIDRRSPPSTSLLNTGYKHCHQTPLPLQALKTSSVRRLQKLTLQCLRQLRLWANLSRKQDG
jgi:hypothetical protein